MDFTHDDVQEILRIVDASTIEELHLEFGEFKLVVRKRAGGAPADDQAARQVAAPAPRPALADRGQPIADAGGTGGAGAARETGPPPPRRSHGVEVKSPMVGTFYRAPAPGAPPFVEVGSVVAEDDTVCLIEVMKLMNSIRAGCRGRIAEICVENGSMVEFGQTLMIVEPLG